MIGRYPVQNRTMNEIIKAWQQRTRKDSPFRMALFCIQAIRLLAQGQPVSVEQVTAKTGLSVSAAIASLNELRQGGAEFDEAGNLVGVVLSLNPTSHQFQVNGQQLYAWCALDALFLPALLERPARVETTCPATGVRIQLTVTPEGIEATTPTDTVLSVVIPGSTPGCTPGAKSGPQGPICSPMHFFSSPDAAGTWLVAHPDVILLSLEEAWRLVCAVWIEPIAPA